MNTPTPTNDEMKAIIKKLISLCLTDGKAAKAYCDTLPDAAYLNSDLVRCVENYNPNAAGEIPTCQVVRDEIIEAVNKL